MMKWKSVEIKKILRWIQGEISGNYRMLWSTSKHKKKSINRMANSKTNDK